MQYMTDRTETIQIRCSEEEKARWKEMEARVDPMGKQADSLMRIVDVFESNPSMFTPDYR